MVETDSVRVRDGRARAFIERRLALALAISAGLALSGCTSSAAPPPPPRAVQVAAAPSATPSLMLRDLGPRLISNQTAQPLALYGDGFTPGLMLSLGAPFSRELPLVVLDARHAYARLPADLTLSRELIQAQVPVSVRDGPRASQPVTLTVVNDAGFPDLTAMARSTDGRFLFIASPTTDTVFALEPATRKVTPLKVGDGPSAIAVWGDSLVVAHAFSPELRLVRFDGATAEQRTLPAPAYASGLAIDAASGTAYVAEHARDTVTALHLPDGKALWTAKVLPNPRPMAVVGDALAVGSLGADQLQLLDRATGKERARAQPAPGIAILGGGTERYSAYVMGGKAPRALVPVAGCGLLVSNLGPNIGPNPDRMEVSMNGGVSVVALSPKGPRFTRHLGFGAGLPEGLAVDDRAGKLYAADVALGTLKVLDLHKLCGAKDEAARGALVQELPIPPPPGFPSVRPAADLGRKGLAGVEIHSGPRSVALSPDGKTLYVLDRFTGTVAVVDAVGPGGRAAVREQLPIVDTLAQRARRLGQVLYHADIGRTGITCDGCHMDGHAEGVFFAKTRPLRIYRSPTLRGSRETPPYFTPASTRSLAQTAKEVGGRNRLHRLELSAPEIEDLALFNSVVAPLPNPFVGADGAPAESLQLPDGHRGNPRRGLALFEGKADCAGCHPAPHFTTDQDPATRGRTYDVGTPRALPLREAMQDLMPPSFGPPSLTGLWDVFPLLTSGAGGFSVAKDGTLQVKSDFPLREVVEAPGERHGRAAGLTPQERDDLLAYLLSL